jgi:hypothetical protein
MKSFSISLIVLVSLLSFNSCTGKRSAKNNIASEADSVTVPDTGFTGIKQGMSGRYIVNEVTYKNGVRNGLMKTFYQSGKLRQTFWYVNGLRQDSAIWFWEEGQVFRTTPFKNDTIDGVQKQYYRTGKLRARLSYIKGLRTPQLEEYTSEGKLVTGYPQLVVSTVDEYKSKGIYRINLSLSDKSTKVKYYRGDFSGGVFDTAHCEKIKTTEGIGKLTLRKSGSTKTESVGVIASILTGFGNNYLVYKKIELPYSDLK